ncbi:MAG: flagellar biosynthesis repressor FlbT [Rhodospirillales bacterium]
MSALVLELRAGETMIVNGAPIRFRTRSKIELTSHVRFLFGKQIMAPNEADSPARRIYFALQAAYIGNDEERPRGLHAARSLIEEFKDATTSAVARDILDRALSAAEADNCYKALKLTGRVIQHEDVALGRMSAADSANSCGTKTAWNGPIPSLRSNNRHENHDPCHTSL